MSANESPTETDRQESVANAEERGFTDGSADSTISRTYRWLKFLKLLLGVVVAILTIGRLLGWL